MEHGCGGAACGLEHIKRLPVELIVVSEILVVAILIVLVVARGAVDLRLDVLLVTGGPLRLRYSTMADTSSSDTKAPWA
ncbi:MAG TPA: hypothetical protein PLE80_06055, partial [Opitutaceae bacterium]|nr:hypothetical protein [Opitutaceae bacterium]